MPMDMASLWGLVSLCLLISDASPLLVVFSKWWHELTTGDFEYTI